MVGGWVGGWGRGFVGVLWVEGVGCMVVSPLEVAISVRIFVWGDGKGVVYEVSGCGVRFSNPISGSIFMFLVLIPVFMRFSLHCCGGGVY